METLETVFLSWCGEEGKDCFCFLYGHPFLTGPDWLFLRMALPMTLFSKRQRTYLEYMNGSNKVCMSHRRHA